MIKIFSVEQIRSADEYTISNEPVTDIDLMERAAVKCTEWICSHTKPRSVFKIFCGPGNNGGDGLAIARLLFLKGKSVRIYIPFDPEELTGSSKVNYNRLVLICNDAISTISHEKDFPSIENPGIIIDCLFGTGLSRRPKDLFESLIKHINDSKAFVISIDIPSGLFADKAVDDEKQAVINATITLTFQFPKLSFLLPDSGKHAGIVTILDIGLHQRFIDNTPSNAFLIEEKDIVTIKKTRKPFSHKGTNGHSLIISGSFGKIGAAVLATKACLKSGSGLVTANVPHCGYNILQTTVPEAMVVPDDNEKHISGLIDISKYNVIGIGPGIGSTDETANTLKQLIQNCRSPIVIDADALNILAENKTWLSFLPPGCILTPHPGEFERLAGKWTNSFERMQMQINFSKKYYCFLILKGHYTCITFPDGKCYFNPTGNPGMATAGSGDVLTGIFTGLLAQNYSPSEASLFGTYLHGLAGDLAAAELSMEALSASDIINYIGKAYIYLTHSQNI